MDKKMKWKLILPLCFIFVSGAVFLCLRYGDWENRSVVLEKRSDRTKENAAAADAVSPGTEEQRDSMVTNRNGGIVVHICGAVVMEGVYSLPEGSRVSDGITAAGGFGEGADTAYHNLAAYLTDGQKVYVPTLEETGEVSFKEHIAGYVGEDRASEQDAGTRKVNLNTAGLTELMTLSGIGEAKAESIIQYREKVGPFQSIDELKKVSGIGEAMFERIKECVEVE